MYSTFVSGTFDGVLTESLVAMENDNTVGGDSGGPWSFRTEATGIYTGDAYLWSSAHMFTVADLFPVSVHTSVRIQ